MNKPLFHQTTKYTTFINVLIVVCVILYTHFILETCKAAINNTVIRYIDSAYPKKEK